MSDDAIRELAAQGAKLDDLRSDVSSMGQAVRDMSTAVTRLATLQEQQVGRLSEQISAHSARLDCHEGRIDSLESTRDVAKGGTGVVSWLVKGGLVGLGGVIAWLSQYFTAKQP